MAFSTTQPTRIVSPITAWLVENAHTRTAPSAIPTAVVARSMVHTRRRTAGRSMRNWSLVLCRTPDL
jgi:hypothetical protein